MLRKGHHQVRLDAAAWGQLVTWIDLNAPCHGRWSDVTNIPGDQCRRRLELRTLFGGLVENWELEPELDTDYDWPAPIVPAQDCESAPAPNLPGWPVTAEQARQLQAAAGPVTRVIDLGDGVRIEFVRIPAGTFVMGDPAGEPDERPARVVTISQPFWMARHEISNEQFTRFDGAHDSRFEHRTSWIFSEEYLGWKLNHPRQPVVRISWHEAVAFCQWLGRKTGQQVRLPTEAQWEYACRAGAATDLSYGGVRDDFSRFGNMADANLRRLADEGWRPKAPDLVPRDNRFNDGSLVTCDVGRYAPNAWGLHDMHGNAAEWTASAYLPYSGPASIESAPSDLAQKVVARGGSWRDRPKYCRSAYRYAYAPYQKVYNVGFRVIIAE
jgi:formylglycine-generating enzyme required for sulfatase activity